MTSKREEAEAICRKVRPLSAMHGRGFVQAGCSSLVGVLS